MTHSKASVIADVEFRSKAIMGALVKEDAKIGEGFLDLPKDVEDYKMAFIVEGYKWLDGVFTTKYETVLRIKKMQTEEMWNRYRNWGGFDDHREVVLLRKAISDLRAAIVSRKRPDFFKKSKRSKPDNKIKTRHKAEDPSETTEGCND